MEELTTDTLDQIIKENDKVFVQYGASWCGACRMIKPQVVNLAGENESVKFLYVDAEKLPNSRQLANVENLPTFAGFVNGELVKQAMGTKIESVKGVVDEVTSN
ncbi:MAG: thioredoxin family protein [Bacteriovoracaceae bacterium]|nr:thioredoxin family protein [Bacteriovoracaceae bacterium]